MIEARDIIKKFQTGQLEQTVLKGISLSVTDGEFISIIGPSGAGKSTLLYQLSLLDQPTSGHIRLKNKNTAELTNEEKTHFRLENLGYIFQDYALLPELTACENVMIPLLMQGKNKRIAEHKAHDVLSRVGLGKRLDNLPSQMSGGEQQRVSIARAIAHTPAILFADEPTANLDSATSRGVVDVLLELHRGGQTIVMVTHEMEYAEMTERIIELRDGQIVGDRKTGSHKHH